MNDAGRPDRSPAGGRLWGIPASAWGAGLPIGVVIGLLLFDELIIALMFGVSIGTAFAIAFAGGSRAARDGDRDAPQR